MLKKKKVSTKMTLCIPSYISSSKYLLTCIDKKAISRESEKELRRRRKRNNTTIQKFLSGLIFQSFFFHGWTWSQMEKERFFFIATRYDTYVYKVTEKREKVHVNKEQRSRETREEMRG